METAVPRVRYMRDKTGKCRRIALSGRRQCERRQVVFVTGCLCQTHIRQNIQRWVGH